MKRSKYSRERFDKVDFVLSHCPPDREFRSAPPSGRINAFTFLPEISCGTRFVPFKGIIARNGGKSKGRKRPKNVKERPNNETER